MADTTNYRIRFMANNLAALSKNSLTVSSEVSGFEGTNALNNFRSSTWKCSGHFEISDGSAAYDGSQNDQLYINDGSNKTITVTAGNYTTPAALATQIQTDLNTSSSGWTCTYDSTTNKFTIGNSSSVTLRLSQSTNSIWDDLGYTTSSDLTGTSFESTENRIHTSEYLRFDMGWQTPIDFTALISDISKSFPLSSTATVTLKANNIDTNWGSAPFSQTLTVTDKGVFVFQNDTDAKYRFWRLEIVDRTNTGGVGIELGQVYLGSWQTLTSRNVSTGFAESLSDPSVRSESEAGVLYFDKRSKFTRFSDLRIENIGSADMAIIKDVFNNVGKTSPFYVTLDPLTSINSDITVYTKYVLFDSEPIYENIMKDVFSTTLQLREVI